MFIHTEYYVARKKEGHLDIATTLMDLEDTVLGEMSRHKRTHIAISTHRNSLKSSDPTETQNRMASARGWGEEERKLVLMGTALQCGDMEGSRHDDGDGGTAT